MANRRRENVNVRPGRFDTGVASILPSGGTPDISAGDRSLAGVSLALSSQAGKFADELAVVEGTRAGRIAGQDGDYRPDDGLLAGTLRQRSHDKAATDVYFSNVMARYRSDAATLFDETKGNPQALASGLAKLKQSYVDKDVFPQIKGYFDASALNVESAYRRQAAVAFDARRRDENRAALITGVAASDEARRRLLAINPDDPAAEKEIVRLRDENIARINAGVADRSISATQAVRLVADERNKAWQELFEARAARMTSPEDIEAYRRNLREAYGAGKLPQFSGFAETDAKLARMGQALATRQKAALNGLDRKFDDFLARYGDGRAPSAAEWVQLEAAARSAGPGGMARLELARAKLGVRVQVNALPLAQAEAYVRDLEKKAAASPSTSGAYDLADASGNRDPAQVRAMNADVRKKFTQLANLAGGDLVVTPHGGVRSDGSNPGSQHHPAHGRAADISIAAMSDAQKADLVAKAIALGATGIGSYSAGAGVGTVHIDFRDKPGNGPGGLALWHRAKPGVDGAWQSGPAWYRDGIQRGLALRGKPGAFSGMNATEAEVIKDARAALAARRKLVASDPLLAAEREGRLILAPLDFNAAPDALREQLGTRLAQASALGEAYGRAVPPLRREDLAQVRAIMDKGGQKAMDVLASVVGAAGPQAPAVLKQIGGDAPALAHAGLILHVTGDRAFAAQVAEAQKARKVAGTKVASPLAADVDRVMRAELGQSLSGMSGDERERTKAAAILWAEAEYARRNIDPKTGGEDILREAFQRARGRTMDEGRQYGGLVRWRPGMFGGGGIPVQAPPNVEASRFGEVLGALTAEDIKAMPDAPVDRGGKVISPRALAGLIPMAHSGGYTFGQIDRLTGIVRPLAGKSGKVFVLDWKSVEERLQQRLPSAFKYGGTE